MLTAEAYSQLAERWARLIMDLDVLLGESDTLHVEVPNITYHAFAALRALPDEIRDGRAIVPQARADEDPDREAGDG